MSSQPAVSRQASKSNETKDRVVRSTADLIRKAGMPSASPVRISRHTGLSWGAVQHHFGTKEELLRAIVSLAREEFVEAIVHQRFTGLALAERVSHLVDAVWSQYRGDLFRAAVEIAFWHRSNDVGLSDTILGREGDHENEVVRALARAFEGLGIPTDVLLEAITHMHCVLTGIAYQEILTASGMLSHRHLQHCKGAVEAIILAGKIGAQPGETPNAS